MSPATETIDGGRAVRPAAEDPAPTPESPVIVIECRPGWKVLNLGELWQYRELLFFLGWRDVKVRMKQTVLGFGWVILQPLATMIVFSVIFGKLAKVPSVAWPYPLFVLAGVLPWTFFANAINSASGSVVSNQNLITKIYFPRIMIPMGAVGAGLFDFAIAFVLLLAFMASYAVTPGWEMLLMPVLVILLALSSLGVGALLAALAVTYRDIRSIVPFMLQLWMFATPCIYMTDDVVGPRWRALLPLNPAYGLIKNFRSTILGGPFDLYSLGVSGAVGLILLVGGCLYFRRVERNFADVI